MNMEQDPNPDPATNDIDPTVTANETDDDDAIVAVEKNAKGESVAPVADLIRYRKESKASKREVESMRSELEQLRGVKDTLAQYQPILQRIQQDPSILTRANAPAQREAEDVEARELAEDLGFITADGGLDVSRARRVIDRMDQRNGKLVDQRMAPLAQTTASQTAEGHKHRAKATRMKDGSPVASDESIEQVFAMLPAELSANPQVAALLPIMAAGLDKMTGRTPKAPVARYYDDPYFTEPAGRGGRPASVLNDDDKRFAKGLGLDEKKFADQVTQMQTNGRRGVALE